MSSHRYERVRPLLTSPPFPPRLSLPRTQTHHQKSPPTNNNQVLATDADNQIIPPTPTSPPPSFRSRASSPQSRHDAHRVDQNLADTFDADGFDSDEENDGDDRQRLMRGTPSTSTTTAASVDNTPESTAPTANESTRPPVIERRMTHLPVFAPSAPPTGRIYGGGSGSDGVFANLSAKPEPGEKVEEHPPVSLSLFFLPYIN